MIKFNQYTWYSKLASIIFFVGVLPVWTFYIGIQYERTYSAVSEVQNIIPASKVAESLFEKEMREKPVLTIVAGTDMLVTNSATPIILGTYNGDSAVGIVILKGKRTLPKKDYFSDLPDSVAVDYSDHGGGVNLSPTKPGSGTFTYGVSRPLEKGTYTIGVYVYHTIYTDSEFAGVSIPVLTAESGLVVQ